MNNQANSTDMAIDILLDVARSIAPEIPESLIRRVYGIETSRQYDEDPDLSRNDVQKALESYAAEISAAQGSAS